MNSKERSIGIDREALDQQLREKAEAANNEKEEKLEQGVFCFLFTFSRHLNSFLCCTDLLPYRLCFVHCTITALPRQPKN